MKREINQLILQMNNLKVEMDKASTSDMSKFDKLIMLYQDYKVDRKFKVSNLIRVISQLSVRGRWVFS